jgi:hypothetical protein
MFSDRRVVASPGVARRVRGAHGRAMARCRLRMSPGVGMRLAMLQVGQEVVLMSFPGRFRIVEVDGDVITIENDAGIRKKVLSQAVRVMAPKSS